MNTVTTGSELHASQCWDALTTLLRENLENVDVDVITDKDFDGEDLVLRPPAVRVMYAGTGRRLIDNQSMNYESVHRFLVMTGAEDLRTSADQARASLRLSEWMEGIAAGARLRLPTQEVTESLTLLDREPMEVVGLGTVFATAIECPGPQQFQAAYANPGPFVGDSDA